MSLISSLVLICFTFAFAMPLSTTHNVDTVSVQFPQNKEHADSLWQNLSQKVLTQTSQARLLLNETPHMSGLWLPGPEQNLPLLILSSGVHGSEAFAGTTLQRLFVEQWLNKTPKPKVHLLLIHGINDYGFMHNQRANAAHVDLNRNFHSQAEISIPNPNYQKLQSLLEPRGPATASWWDKLRFTLKIIYVRIVEGKKAILGALQGQSESAQGLFYTGQAEQPETKVVKAWLTEFIQPAQTVLHIDLHTGFGERGRLHFFGSSQFTSPEKMSLLKMVFQKAPIDLGSDDDFYVTHGDLTDWTWKTFPDKKVIPMVFEFGTMDSQTLWGGLNSLWIGVIHNQAVNYGSHSPKEREKIDNLTTELFNPPDFEWQKQVLEQGSHAIWESLENVSHL